MSRSSWVEFCGLRCNFADMAKIGINIKQGKIELPKVIVGIDLGTTNSLIAYVPDQANSGNADVENGRSPKVIPVRGQGLVPSVVYFDEHGSPSVGHYAKSKIAQEPERTIFSVKRLLGKSYKDVADKADYVSYKIIDTDSTSEAMVKIEIDGKFYNPIELSSLILKEIKTQAEKELSVQIEQAVITVPAYFNDSQRQATRDAGKLAGLDVLRIINEPTAASIAYGIAEKKSGNVLVYDLGGGTFDVSILTLEEGVFEVLSTHGNTYLGGDDLDRSIAEFWLKKHHLTSSQLSKTELQTLRMIAEEAKIYLSQDKIWGQSEAHFERTFQCINSKLILTLNVSELQNAVAPLIAETLKSVHKALSDAELKPDQIDEVVLVGGSTRYPGVMQALMPIFPHVSINNRINPDEVVALGAAIEADVLAGNRSDVLLLDVTPLSLGIETAGGLMDVLIPRNSKIPTRLAREYTTSVDGQVNLKVSVFQGERELVGENRKLGEFVLKGIPAMPAGLPKIQIQFALNPDGILKVAAKELRSGVEQEVEIQPTYGLTDSQVEEMLLAGFQNAQSDIELRLNQETINEGNQMVYTAERFIEKNGQHLSAEEIAGSKQRIEDLRCLLNDKADRNAINKQIEMLNDYTRPFAERVMDIAIGQALKGKTLD